MTRGGNGNGNGSTSSGGTTGGSRPYLRIEDVDKSFGSFQALRDISLDIYEGEFVCFLGPSGCGKTTLLRAIAGLDPQTSGRIEQAGRDISQLPPAQRDFGIVFQSYALFPNLTVAKNVGYGLASRQAKREQIEKRVRELLDMVGLADQAKKYPAQLSGGQQQRIALARALATSPGLLLLDEPLSALDAKVRVHLRKEIKELQRKLGLTTIMVTHDQEEALIMADRVVVMNNGVIEQVGTPNEIYGEPTNRFVADFIGQMNFLPGLVIDEERARLGSVDLRHPRSPAGLTPGSAVTLCVRPEDVVVRRQLEREEVNAFPAQVSDLDFIGNFFRARLAADCLDGMLLAADLPSSLVRTSSVAPGMPLSVALPSDRIRVFPAA